MEIVLINDDAIIPTRVSYHKKYYAAKILNNKNENLIKS